MGFSRKSARLLWQGGLIGGTVFLLSLFIWQKGWLETWEYRTWDLRARALADPASARGDIVLVLVDQTSLDWTSDNGIPWPWPREFYGALLDFFARGGARSVTFDILFDGDSALGVYDDRAFTEAMKRNGTAVLACFIGNTAGRHTVWPDNIPPPNWFADTETAGPWPAFPDARRAVFPPPEMAAAPLLGNIQAAPDRDNIFRRVPLFKVFDGQLVPSLGLAAALADHPDAALAFRPGTVHIGDYTIPVDAKGQAILRFHGPFRTFPSFTAASLLQSELRLREGLENPVVDPEEFRDKAVFIGYSAPGLFDYRPTPMEGTYPGVGIHATVLDNLLSDRFMRKVPDRVSVALLAVLCLAGAIGLTFAGTTWLGGLGLALTLGIPSTLAALAYLGGWWLPLVVLQTGAVLTVGSALMTSYIVQGRQQRFIRNAFQQYLSPAVIEELVRSPERLQLGGEYRQLSIFFSDLSGFTSLSEKLNPAQLTALLNEYLTAMTDLILVRKGTIDKYEGDAIIAFWNAPVDVPDHPVRAVEAALQCQQKLTDLRGELKARYGFELHMRIGINTGPAIVGNLGSTMRFDYSMLGDAVNLAARLEGVNKVFGTGIIISGSTREAIGEAFPVREIARVGVVGRREAVTLFEPFTSAGFARRKTSLRRYAEGLTYFYEGDWTKALTLFEPLEANDPCAAALAGKCREWRETPPENWAGIWRLQEK